MKIAVLSDIHEGLNRNDRRPEKSLSLLNRLQNDFPKMKLLYVHGNHDVYYEDSDYAYDQLLQFNGNLGNGPVELDENWVVIGDGGWYDYSFGIEGFTEKQFSEGKFADFTWPDKQYAHWSERDYGVAERSLEKIEGWLKEYRCNPLGYYPHEWQNDTAEEEIASAIKIIEI